MGEFQPMIMRRLWEWRAALEQYRGRLRSLVMVATESEILAEAERGEVVCVLYEGTYRRNEEGLAKDRLCHQLADADKLRLIERKGSPQSPFGMVSKWIKA